MSDSLVIFTKASQMLAEADTIQKAKELKSLALTAADWAKRKNMGEAAILHCRSYALQAERKMGEMLAATERRTRTHEQGGGSKGSKRVPLPDAPPTLAALGLSKRESAEAQGLAAMPQPIFDEIIEGKKTRAEAKRETKRAEIAKRLSSISSRKAEPTKGVYDVIVVDPPWPMQKIERDVRPNQTAFDYPVMEEETLQKIAIPAAPDCHLWLWTTHRFLPMAFRLLSAWDFKYVCCFCWHKPGGFQPVGLPQYNCEFALYARKGSPVFVSTKALPVCFLASRGKHSEKPEAFYEMVRRVTAGRRLDMFARRKIEGFEAFGNEAKS